ncbi:MAG: DoxX family protein [Deltaproteobacteria bacterium]|nr:MAG: DoxX family protein [Deltaproteobacteria bacterium]
MNTSSSSPSTPSRGLHVTLWVAQLLLAVTFGMAGGMKALTPIDPLAETLPWVADSPGLARFVGTCELAGAVGVVLPAATRIAPALTPLAAAGLGVVMVLAAGFHAMRGEFSMIPVNVALLALAAFVAWGRWKKAPIRPKS